MNSKFEKFLEAKGITDYRWTKPNSRGWVNAVEEDNQIHYGFKEVEGGFEVNDLREGNIFMIKDGQDIPVVPKKVIEPICNDFLQDFNKAHENRTKAISKRLKDKGVTQRAAFIYDGNLHIPYYTEVKGPVVGCQIQAENGRKWSIKGSRMTGAFTILQHHDTISKARPMGLIAEGYTTACQLADLFPDAFIACAAGMGNLTKVYETLLEAYPEVAFVVALDKAKGYQRHTPLLKVIEIFNSLNIPYIQPNKYDNRLHDDTDFNDMVLRIGKESTQEYIMRVYRTQAPLLPEVLPKAGESHVILSHRRGGILTLPVAKEASIYHELSPAALQEFTQKHFNDTKAKKGQVARQLVIELLQQHNNSYNGLQKGVGGYYENENYIFNFIGGRYRLDPERKLYHEPHYRPIGENYYVDISANEQLSIPADVNFTAQNYGELVTAFSKVYPDLSLLYAGLGHLVQASYAGFSDFRAHTWITGPSGSGKSLLKDTLGALGKGSVSIVQDISKAGLTQYLNPTGYTNTTAILADECAADTVAKKKNIDEIIKVMREMSNVSENAISLRGTSEQKVKVYQYRAGLYLASTSSYIDDYQDKSRIFEVDINEPVKPNANTSAAELIELAEKLNKVWQKMIIQEAPYYKLLTKLCLEKINNEITVPNLSHKPRVWAALAAGYACIGHAITNKSLEFCAERSVNSLKKLFIIDKERQLSFLKGSRNIVDRLVDFDVMLNGLASRMSLVEALRSPDEAEALYRKYGVKINKQGQLKIRSTDYKLDNLLSNSRIVVNPIYDSQSLLREAVAQKLPNIVPHVSRCPILGKSARFYILDLPKTSLEEKEDDGVISFSKKSS